jgi:hypothetical protein
VGISKADLKAKSFQEITDELQSTFAGSATAAANTFQGSIDKLGVASANVSEIIGTGLIDALTNLGEDTSVADLAANMEKAALYIADVIRGVGVLAAKLKDLPIIGSVNVGMIPIVGTYLTLLREAGKQAPIQKASDNQHLQSLQQQYKIDTKISKISTKLTADELKKLKAKQLQQAIDKANLALGKGEEVFDMDKIQIAAALTSQAEQLGKTTNGAQLLQIANDTARLNVKKSILALEDAMATKDEAAIKAATAKLNADLGILGALTGQDAKLKDIKSILDGLKPKELIDLDNLKEALHLLKEIALGSGTTVSGTTTSRTAPLMPKSLMPIKGPVGAKTFSNEELQYFEDLNEAMYADLFANGTNPFTTSSSSSAPTTIVVNTGIGDPNAIAEAIDQVLREAQQRGTLAIP